MGRVGEVDDEPAAPASGHERRRDAASRASLRHPAGDDVQACRAYLQAHAPGLVATFEDAVARAAAEE